MPERAEKSGKERFLHFLAGKRLRITSQRRAIIDTVFATEEHFTAEELLEWSRARDHSVSRATVYRTLPLLTASGLVGEMDFGKNRKYYDPNYADRPYHNHIVCLDCGRIVEFDSDRLAELEGEIRKRLGFSVQSRRLYMSASCEALRKPGGCPRRQQTAATAH